MFDLELTIQALAGAALALFLTPALRPLGLSEGAARCFRLASYLVFAAGMAVAIGATIHWLIR